MSDTEPLFLSVILPVYNGARFLPRAVESVRRQPFARWELLAVDDGSTDDSLALLTDLAAQEPQLRVIRRDDDGGGGGALAGNDRAALGRRTLPRVRECTLPPGGGGLAAPAAVPALRGVLPAGAAPLRLRTGAGRLDAGRLRCRRGN